MPFQINWEQNGVVVNFTGVFDLEVCKAANDALYTNPKTDALEYVVWDLSRVEKLDFSEQYAKIPAIRDRLATHRLPRIKMGFVVSDEPMAHLCMQYIIDSSVYGSSWEFNVSDNLEGIREWISS